jgi:hypothetical protein
MMRFWAAISGIVGTLAGLVTILTYVSNAEIKAPYPRPSPQPDHSSGPVDPGKTANPAPYKSPEQKSLDDRYALPIGETTISFEQCLSKRGFVLSRDFSVNEISPLYRFIIPLVPPDSMASAYEECREQFTQR